MSDRVSLTRQIGELKAERLMRERVFPRRVAKGEMKQAAADYRNESLDAAIATLEWVRDHEATIRRVHGEIESGEIAT